MELFDSLFKSTKSLLYKYPMKELDLSNADYEVVGDDQIILKSDAAFELGENKLPGLSGLFITSDHQLVNDNKVYLIGKDLNEIKENNLPYAKLIFCRVNDEYLGKTTNDVYQNIRKIDYTRYHINPFGYMTRISPINQVESIRVSKQALKRKINFAKVGKIILDSYLRQKPVEAVNVIFITDPNFDYQSLKELIQNSDDITKALDHLLNKVKMDCHSCNLQVVCGEVEKMVKKDFKE